MPKSARELFPPSPVAVERLLEAARQISQPSTAAIIARSVDPPDRLREAAAIPVLENAVLEHKLFRYPPKSPKGKPRYWGQNLAQLVQAAVERTIPELDAPVTAREFLKRLSVPLKLTEAELFPVLQEAVQQGVLHSIPAATAKSQPRFWNRDRNEFGRQTVLEMVRKKGPQPSATLLKSLKGFSREQGAEVLSAALARKELWRHPVCGKVKKELLGAGLPSPAPYLKEVASQLAAIVPVLLAAEVSQSDLRRSLMEIMSAAGVAFSTPPGTIHGETFETASSSRCLPDLITLMKQIEPGAARGALVGTAALRRAAGMGKQEFDHAVLELARQQQLTLHRHDYPASLLPDAREALVFDGNTTYYAGVALRLE